MKPSDGNIKEILESCQIHEILGIKGDYWNRFIDRLNWVYHTTDDVWKNSKYIDIRSFLLKILIILLGSVLSIIRFGKYRRQLVGADFSKKVIAMPFCGLHVRFEVLFDLVDDLTMLYPPIFHYEYIEKHINSFRKKNRKISLAVFNIKDVLSVLCICIRHYFRLKKCNHTLNVYYNSNTSQFANAFVISLLYQFYIKRIVSSINNSSPKIWLFDYDFDFKYIVFNSEIKKYRPNDTTIHVQHGAFYTYVDYYCNPVSDISLCCSRREQAIIEEYNKFGKKIMPLGASLQSFSEKPSAFVKNSPSYDILLLLTDTFHESHLELQKQILSKLKRSNFKSLVRYRPATKLSDKTALGAYTTGMVESVETTLASDISNAKVVVSFSEDAIFECFRQQKKIVFCVEDKSIYDYSVGKSSNVYIETKESFNVDIIEKCLALPNIDYSDDAFVTYNFGEFTFERIKSNLNCILNDI